MALHLPVFRPLVERPEFVGRLNAIRDRLLSMNETESVRSLQLAGYDRLLKTTISLCPTCLQHVPAAVYTLENRVLMRKLCPDHGPADALVESDVAFYRLSNKDQWGRRFAGDSVVDFPAYQGECCGGGDCSTGHSSDQSIADFTDQSANKSCTVLVEVTNACNLACPVCYSDARGDRKMPLDTFKHYIRRLIEQKGGLDSVQLTGGEAVLHPEFWEMVADLHVLPGVKRIYIPSNGIIFSNPEVARKLVPFKDKLMLLLQFDGQDVSSNRSLRSANTVKLRRRVIDHLQELGVCMQLTMTVARGVNDSEVGWVVDTAMRSSVVKVVALQPVTYSGRYDLEPDPMTRLTLSDVVKAVMAQARKRMTADQFVPIPCSHPNCGWITLFARRIGFTLNIVKHIDLARAFEQVAYKTVLSTPEIRQIIGGEQAPAFKRAAAAVGRKLIRARDVLAIAVKPFMDRYNYDQDRVSACCHHLLDTRGRPVSFCEYNARLRPTDLWDGFPILNDD